MLIMNFENFIVNRMLNWCSGDHCFKHELCITDLSGNVQMTVIYNLKGLQSFIPLPGDNAEGSSDSHEGTSMI